jgi:hypothetical protein
MVYPTNKEIEITPMTMGTPMNQPAATPTTSLHSGYLLVLGSQRRRYYPEVAMYLGSQSGCLFLGRIVTEGT